MTRYHLTCSQNFYGQRDPKTYYNVSANKVWGGCRYMANEFGANVVFVYEADNTIGSNSYIGCYSKRYDNFRTSDGQLHSTFNF